MRSNNLEKQAHLLTAAELKKRGITRYDAEIILAQGVKLPEPRVSPQLKKQAVHRQTARHAAKTSPVARGRGRFLRKGRQKRLETLSAVLQENREENVQKERELSSKEDQGDSRMEAVPSEGTPEPLSSPTRTSHSTTSSLLEQPSDSEGCSVSPTNSSQGSRPTKCRMSSHQGGTPKPEAAASATAVRTPTRSITPCGGVGGASSPKVLRGTASPRIHHWSPERAATSTHRSPDRLRVHNQSSDTFASILDPKVRITVEDMTELSSALNASLVTVKEGVEIPMAPRRGVHSQSGRDLSGLTPRRLRRNSSTFIDDLEAEAAALAAQSVPEVSSTSQEVGSHCSGSCDSTSSATTNLKDPKLRELLCASPQSLRSPRIGKEEQMPRLRKEISLSPKRLPPVAPPEKLAVPPVVRHTRGDKKEMPVLVKEEITSGDEADQESSTDAVDNGRPSVHVKNESKVSVEGEQREGDHLSSGSACVQSDRTGCRLEPPDGDTTSPSIAPPRGGRLAADPVTCTDLNHNDTRSSPDRATSHCDTVSMNTNCLFPSTANWQQHKRRKKSDKSSSPEVGFSRSSSTGSIPHYETQFTSGLAIKIRNTSKMSSSSDDSDCSKNMTCVSPERELSKRHRETPSPKKRRHKQMQYDSELIEQQGWKIPKLTIRMRRERNFSDSVAMCGSNNGVHSNGESSQAAEPVYEILSNYCSSSPSPEKTKKKKSKRSKERRRNGHSDNSSSSSSSSCSNGYPGDYVSNTSSHNGIDTQCFYSASRPDTLIEDDRDSEVSFQLPMKRIKLKVGGNATMIDIHLPPNKRKPML